AELINQGRADNYNPSGKPSFIYQHNKQGTDKGNPEVFFESLTEKPQPLETFYPGENKRNCSLAEREENQGSTIPGRTQPYHEYGDLQTSGHAGLKTGV